MNLIKRCLFKRLTAWSPPLDSSDLHVEGLFRVPGNSVRQQALRELLNSGADIDLQSGDFHPNDVATLLKTLLGELPEPLLTHRHFHAHLKIAGRDATGTASVRGGCPPLY